MPKLRSIPNGTFATKVASYPSVTILAYDGIIFRDGRYAPIRVASHRVSLPSSVHKLTLRHDPVQYRLVGNLERMGRSANLCDWNAVGYCIVLLYTFVLRLGEVRAEFVRGTPGLDS